VLIAFLAVIACAALVAYLVVRFTNRRIPPQALMVSASPAIQDAALAQLRLRYARGEISRSDFLQASADLGTPVSRPPEPPETNVQ
jgi:uncharacterized membrane protein